MRKSLFRALFPVPEYLLMPAIGIDISDTSLKYVELKNQKNRIVVSRYGTRIIPKGIIESGEIKNKEKLTNFLKSLQEELGEGKFVVVDLPEERAFLSKVKIPLMSEEEARSALGLQLEEYVPLSPQEAIFDFEIMESVGKEMEINLTAFPKNVVEDYRDVFVNAGLMPVAFELEVQAMARAMIPLDESESCLLVDFGKTRTSFAVVSQGKVRFTSTINVAGEDLNEALSKNLSVNIFEAERIKKEKGFVRSRENENVFNALLPVISVIKDEMKKHIDYWNSHLDSDKKKKYSIKKILLSGGESNLFGLTEYLSYELGIPVKLGNPWVNFVSFEDYIPQIELRESLIYSTAIGLALRSFWKDYD